MQSGFGLFIVKYWRILFGLVVIAMATVAWSIFHQISTTSTLYITSSENATIYVAQEKAGLFEEIGTGSAKFKTRQRNATHFQAVEGDRITRAAVLPQDYDEQTISLDLEELVSSQRIAEGPLTNILVEKDVLYGINRNTHSLSSVNLGDFVLPKVGYINLPFIDKIVWRDSNNFAYQVYGGGLGLYINGRVVDSLPDSMELSGVSLSSFNDLTRYPGKPVIYLGSGGLYSAKNIGEQLALLVDIQNRDLHYLGSDDRNIFFASFERPGHYASELEDAASDHESEDITSISVFDYRGTEVFTAETQELGVVLGLSYLDESNQVIVLTENGLSLVDASGELVHTNYVYSRAINNMFVANDSAYLFATDAIWRFDISNGIFHLYANYPKGHEYVVGSLEVHLAGSKTVLRYTTKPSGTSSRSIAAGTYEIEMK